MGPIRARQIRPRLLALSFELKLRTCSHRMPRRPQLTFRSAGLRESSLQRTSPLAKSKHLSRSIDKEDKAKGGNGFTSLVIDKQVEVVNEQAASR